MARDYGPIIRFVERYYIEICVFYFVTSLGIGFFEALRKKKGKEIVISEEKYNKIFIMLTAPLLFPLLFGMFGLAFYLGLYIIFKYLVVYPAMEFVIFILILWFVVTLFLSVKAYRAIYKMYKDKNSAI